MADKHQYFSVLPTSCVAPAKDRLAIYAGDAPRRNEDGTTSMQLRAPVVIMAGYHDDQEGIAEMIAEVLNENAHRFFESAKTEESGG